MRQEMVLEGAQHVAGLLVDLLLVRRLQPWHGNVKKRLVKSPKVYVRDSGLVHALLRIENKTYGICRVTGKLINKERLKLVPHATLSIEAKNMQK